MWRWSGLRARVAANLAAAVSLTFGLLALTSMAILHRAVRDGERAGFVMAADFVADSMRACPDEPCIDREMARAQRAGLTVRLRDGFGVDTAAQSQQRLSVERQVGGRIAVIGAQPGPMIERIASALRTLLICLAINGVALIVIGTLLFERGVVRRLAQVDEDMARIERLELDSPLVASQGGDEIGRMGGSLHRITERLREDKRRTTDYIAQLERTNRELRETQEGLARSERLATVGRLAAGVAHEIGNPVAAILGYLEILRREPGPPSSEYLERIERETNRVDRIVRDLIDFARPQPPAVGPVNLAQVIDAAARLVEPQPRWRSMQLSRSVPASLPLVAAQEHYATQVIVNLLINAADACGGRGVVNIAAHEEPGAVVLEVVDDGPGIKAEDAGRVFDPFFTTKAPGEGVGLGLSISHRLMDSFGGSISVRQGVSRGAVFVLTFRAAGAA